MTKNSIFFSAAIAIFAAIGVAGAAQQKIPVCHFDTKTDSVVLIYVNENALSVHEAHGDTIDPNFATDPANCGACGVVCAEGQTCADGQCVSGPSCGDGVTDSASEVCDDGNTVTETECPEGVPDCIACSANCQALLNLSGHLCGNGIVEVGETCDDGDTVTETVCPYGTATCVRCTADCQVLSLTGNVCGDGVRDLVNERCDDFNTDDGDCCSASCQALGTNAACAQCYGP